MIAIQVPTDTEANAAGYDTAEVVRDELIRQRDEQLKQVLPDFNQTVFLSHAIWWMSHITEAHNA